MIHMYRTHSKTKHFITIKSLNQIYENASVVITCGQQYLYTRFPFYYCMLYQISIYDEIYTCHRACKCRLSPFFAPHFLISSEFAKKPESVLSKTSLSSIYFLSVKTSRLENFPIHPWNLTWNLKRSHWKRRFLLETIRFHVKFRGSKSSWKPPFGRNTNTLSNHPTSKSKFGAYILTRCRPYDRQRVPLQWPYKWVTGEKKSPSYRSHFTPFIIGRCPPCIQYMLVTRCLGFTAAQVYKLGVVSSVMVRNWRGVASWKATLHTKRGKDNIQGIQCFRWVIFKNENSQRTFLNDSCLFNRQTHKMQETGIFTIQNHANLSKYTTHGSYEKWHYGLATWGTVAWFIWAPVDFVI